jgi:hypothetical protein
LAQVAAGELKPSWQYAVPHDVAEPGTVHAVRLEPLQKPPQAPVPAQAGRPARGMPWIATHVPIEPAWLHDSHWPVQAVLQQTPSTQCPALAPEGTAH